MVRSIAPPEANITSATAYCTMELFDQGEPIDRVLNALASCEGASLTGPEIQQRTSLNPAEIVNAVALLEFMGTVHCTYWDGSAPFDFSSTELTPEGRLQCEQPISLSRAEQCHALKREMSGIWSRPGPDPLPRFAKMLRGSSLSREEVGTLLDLVPGIRTGTTGDNCRRLYSIISRVYEERLGGRQGDAPASAGGVPSRNGFWTAHVVQIAVGVIISVVAGLILAALL